MYDTPDDKAHRDHLAETARLEGRYIETVWLMQTGMVVVFDQFGNQLPAYQGHVEDVLPRIMQDMPIGVAVVFHGDPWPGHDNTQQLR